MRENVAQPRNVHATLGGWLPGWLPGWLACGLRALRSRSEPEAALMHANSRVETYEQEQALPAHAHHGSKPVRKSVSVQGATAMLPSTTEVCAKGRERGAGPRTTLPFSSYCEP